jgi:hypothetical protein
MPVSFLNINTHEIRMHLLTLKRRKQMNKVFFAKPPNAPSTTGRPSGGGRGNNPPK